MDVASILNFSFKSQDLVKGLDIRFAVADDNLNEKIEELVTVTDRLGASESSFSGESLVPMVFRKFKRSFQGDREPFSGKELRTLCYSLHYFETQQSSIFQNSKELAYAVELITQQWNNSYLIGLFNCLLKSWNTSQRDCFLLLHQIISEKLTAYSGSRRLLHAIKFNSRFFNPSNGDVLLGSQLSIEKIPISDVANYLKLPPNWITYPYFSKVIFSYYDRNKANVHALLPDIEKALLLHSANIAGGMTSKLLISQLVIWADIRQHDDIQDDVKDLAFKLIGDPAKSTYWRPSEGMNDQEKAALTNARDILNGWITRRFITVFFETCINDDRRKRFWLRMAPNVSAFHVFGPVNVKLLLKRDKRIAQYVDSRFDVTSGNRQVSAFLMHVKDYKLVEFSDPGYAFYAYLRSNPSAPSAEKAYASVDEFRDGSLPMAVYRSGSQIVSYSNEGRITHADGDIKWEEVFKRWIGKKLAINV